MIVGGEMSQSKVCPLSSRLNISIWEAQQLFWKSGGVFLQTIFAKASQIVRSHYCSAFTQSCGFRPAIFQRSKVVGLIQCLARGGKTFMDMFWQTCGYFCFPESELTKRMRNKKNYPKPAPTLVGMDLELICRPRGWQVAQVALPTIKPARAHTLGLVTLRRWREEQEVAFLTLTHLVFLYDPISTIFRFVTTPFFSGPGHCAAGRS